MLNKQKGNMYGFVTHTWNPIKGRCRHDCSYCYMKKHPQGDLRLSDDLNDNLGFGKFIFVGSSTDMFAEDVPSDWIYSVLNKCSYYNENKYLFQTKNPRRFSNFMGCFPLDLILCVTLESNRSLPFCDAPSPEERANNMFYDGDLMVTIEPIMDFDLELFVKMIRSIMPKWVNIGADSGNNHLSEPSSEKIGKLIDELKKFTEVRLKDNLKRLYIERVNHE